MFASIVAALAPQVRDAATIGAQGLASAFPDHAAGNVQWFDVALARADGSTFAFDVGCDRTALLRLLGDSLAGRVSANGPLAERLALPAYPTLGRLALSYDEFVRLEPGAVVVLPHRPAGQMAVRVDTVLYEFSQVESGWTCLGGHPAPIDGTVGARMDDTNDPAAGPESEAGTVAVSGLTIAVDFDIAHLSVPVSTLSQWQAGAVVDLDVPATGDGIEVTIRAAGNVIGQGDLVRIDDRLAVRITRLLLRP
jgi:type III secretion system YscQ/HrcQ family protein